MNIDKRQARKAISSNQHNTITTTYYLLLKQKLMRGGTIVVADSNSLEDRSNSPSNPTVSTVASFANAKNPSPPKQTTVTVTNNPYAVPQANYNFQTPQQVYSSPSQVAKAPLRLVSPDQRPTVPTVSATVAHGQDQRSHTYVPPVSTTSPHARRTPVTTGYHADQSQPVSPLLSLGSYQPVDKGHAMHHSGHQPHLFSPNRVTGNPANRADAHQYTMHSPQPRVVISANAQHLNSPPTSYKPISMQPNAASPTNQHRPHVQTPPAVGSPAVSYTRKKHPANLGLDKYRLIERGFPASTFPTLGETPTSKGAGASGSKNKATAPRTQQGAAYTSPKSGKEIVLPGASPNPKSAMKSEQETRFQTVHLLIPEWVEQHPDVPTKVEGADCAISNRIRLVPLAPKDLGKLAGLDHEESTTQAPGFTKVPTVDTNIKTPVNLSMYVSKRPSAKSLSNYGLVSLGGVPSPHSVSGLSNKGSGGANSVMGGQAHSESSVLVANNTNIVRAEKDSVQGSRRFASTTAGSHSIIKPAKPADSGSLSSKSTKMNNIYSNLGNLSSTSRGSGTNSGRVKPQVKSSSMSRERRTIIRSVETGLHRGSGTGRKISNPSFTSPQSDEPRAARSFIGSSSNRDHLNSSLVDIVSDHRTAVVSDWLDHQFTMETPICRSPRNPRFGSARTRSLWTL